jgi:hypothetical protein
VKDFGLHVDSDGPHQDKLVAGVNCNYFDKGSARVTFLPYKRKYLWERQRYRHELVTDVDEANFALGKVDSRKFTGKAFQTVVNPHDLLVFKEGLPLAHDFESLELPRECYIFTGAIAMDDVLYNDSVPRFRP